MITIVFVIPLISKEKSRNWERATNLLQGTIDSLSNQNSSNFKVLIGCHQIPNVKIKNHSQNFQFVKMKYDPLGKQFEDPKRARRDRLLKICTSLVQVADVELDYCMALDADDRVHSNLVEFLEHQPKKDAWIIDRGYQLNYANQRVFKCNHLSHICGSTIILSKEKAGIPQKEVHEEFIKCFWQHHSHHRAKQIFSENHFQYSFVPFYSLQYTLNHQVNLHETVNLNSGKIQVKQSLKNKLKEWIKYYILGKDMSNEEFKNFGYNLY